MIPSLFWKYVSKKSFITIYSNDSGIRLEKGGISLFIFLVTEGILFRYFQSTLALQKGLISHQNVHSHVSSGFRIPDIFFPHLVEFL